MYGAAAGDAGRVEDAVEAVGNGGKHRGDAGFVGHVGGHKVEFGAEVGWARDVGADHGAALGQQAPGGGQADARRRARHHECPRPGAITAHGSHRDTPRVWWALSVRRVCTHGVES